MSKKHIQIMFEDDYVEDCNVDVEVEDCIIYTTIKKEELHYMDCFDFDFSPFTPEYINGKIENIIKGIEAKKIKYGEIVEKSFKVKYRDNAIIKSVTFKAYKGEIKHKYKIFTKIYDKEEYPFM